MTTATLENLSDLRPVPETLAERLRGEPIRICFMIDELSTAGTETQLVSLINRLNRTRFQPYLCLLRGDRPPSPGLEPLDCPVVRLNVRSFRSLATLPAAIRFWRFLRREKIDVLQVYFPESTYFGVPLARLGGVRHIFRTRNNLGYWLTPWHRRLGRLCDQLASGLVANCEACRQAVIRDEGLAPHRIVVLENGVDLERFPYPAPPRGAGPRRIGVTANLRPVKGLDVFLQTAAQIHMTHPDTVFEVAGDGPLRSSLEEQARQLGIDKQVVFLGGVRDIPGFLARLDIAVLPSLSEGMSNALLEYMAAGKAIIATAVGGNRSLIRHGTQGLLIPPGDGEALTVALRQLLDDPPLTARLGQAARQRVEQQYSRQAMVRRFEEFYFRLVGDPGA